MIHCFSLLTLSFSLLCRVFVLMASGASLFTILLLLHTSYCFAIIIYSLAINALIEQMQNSSYLKVEVSIRTVCLLVALPLVHLSLRRCKYSSLAPLAIASMCRCVGVSVCVRERERVGKCVSNSSSGELQTQMNTE